MRWAKWLRLPRTICFRLALLFTLASLLAAFLSIGAMMVTGQLLFSRKVDLLLRAQWLHYMSEPDRLEALPPHVFAAHLEASGRAFRTLSKTASGLEQVFMKPYYGRRGQRRSMDGFWVQTVETGAPRRRYRVCTRELEDGSLFAVAQGLEMFDGVSVQMVSVGVGGFFLMAVLLVVLDGAVARRLLKGMDHAVGAVNAMAAGDFSRRLSLPAAGEEVVQLCRAVNAMAERTEALLADLRSVTDNIAHDLRTPVTRLKARAELALYAEGDVQTLAGEVAEECDGMLELMSSLLEIARVSYAIGVDAGAPTDLAALAARLVDLFSAAAEEKGVALSLHCPVGALMCITVAALVRRALANLLDNAIKFTPAGGKVTVTVESCAAGVRLRVEDSGCGIAPEAQAHVFDRFYRVDAGRTLPGFGLGLALVRAVMQALGGRVSVRSELGKGSEFVLELPVSRT